MLKEIYIKNLAVIKEAVIPLSDKLNIFTGETGAGKSILINGINAVMGNRCSKDLVRTGCDKAVITALFTELDSDILSKLDELGISHENNEITLTREINSDGRSTARINSRTSSASVLKEIGNLLINIHGQHDNQILMDSEKHIKILDSFGGISELLEDYQESFRKLQASARKLGELRKIEHSKAERSRYLNTVIDEIGSLELSEDEEISLEKEYRVAGNAENIIKSLRHAVQFLNGDGFAVELVENAESELEEYSENKEISQLFERLSAVEIELSDISSELVSLCDKTELDSQRLEYLRQRLGEINRLKKKYMCDFGGLIKLYNDSVAEYDMLENSSDTLQKLIQEKETLLHETTEKAKKLSESREKSAEIFIAKVTAELEFLNMPDVSLKIRHEKGKLTLNGMDTMEILISANRGEEPKPVSKIASGGELSRIMLALKSILAEKDSIPTMIFDEIDTGVSGRTAQKIGIKLREIGKVRQVICVTHLSQIAVMADNHLLIEKNTIDDRTETNVYQLDFKGRVAEIARIMGGENPSSLMLETAEAEILKVKELEK
ncbi:MAG: DNA repair protein RecN [Oscillospiraceae bacterium]|nr:DNA repair protein RecN [Oscillospiraceae bacterium]